MTIRNYAKIKKVYTKKFKRQIFCSDIHGDFNVFKKAYKIINISKSDCLFILGDILEKGEESLKLLRYIINLTKEKNVHYLKGNNDEIFINLFEFNDLRKLKIYINVKKSKIIKEIMDECGLNTLDEFFQKKNFLKKKYEREINFIKMAPEIIETEHFILVHAGISNGKLSKQDKKICLEQSFFYNNFCGRNKIVIVGHCPVSMYHENYINHNPIIDNDKKIICIDGGNKTKLGGQINFLTYRNGIFDNLAFDNLKTIKSCHEQSETSNTVNIMWHKRKLKNVIEGEDYSICELEQYSGNYKIYNDFIDFKRLELNEDYTDKLLNIKIGDNIKLISNFKNQYYIKKDGVVGWLVGEIEKENYEIFN